MAIDAVGAALLKRLGSDENIMKRKIFEQERIARAAEIGVGASSPREIEVAPVDEESRAASQRVAEILRIG